jgi:hypothetical protein
MPIMEQEVPISITSSLMRGVMNDLASGRAVRRKRGRAGAEERAAARREKIMDLFVVNGEDYKSPIPPRSRLRVAGHIRSTRNHSISEQLLVGATRDNQTYHFIQPANIACSLLAPPKRASSVTNRRHRKGIVRRHIITRHVNVNGLSTFTSEIFGVALSSKSAVVLNHCRVDAPDEPCACYSTPEAAMNASIVRTICEIPYRNEGKTVGGVPVWVNKLLPVDHSKDPLWNYCVLYLHRNVKGRLFPKLFGILSFWGDDRILSVSKDGHHEFEVVHFTDVGALHEIETTK